MSSIDKIAGQVAQYARLDKAAKDARKKARQRERRAAKQELSAAVSADNWEDRPDKARPTKQRRDKGAFVLRDGDDAGVTVAVDEAVTVLDRLCSSGQITTDQRQGGLDFAALMERTRLVGAGRSCLNFEPVGHEGDHDDWQTRRDEQERQELYLACGMAVWAEMRRVCHEGKRPRRIDHLRTGLGLCVKFWGKC